MNLVRNHRTMGYVVGQGTADGKPVVILQTSPTAQAVAPAHLLLPVTPAEVAFEARMALAAAIERAIFLGIDRETLQTLFNEEIERSSD